MNACGLATNYAPVIGRALLALIFLQSGWDKVFNFQKVAGMMAKNGIPFTEPLLVLSIVIVLAGGLMILLGWYARWAALVLCLWMIPVTLIFHAYWTYPPEQVFNQTNHFLKNLVVIGFLLNMIGMGSGPYSLRGDQCGADVAAGA
jgi:putative oxidoreductase